MTSEKETRQRKGTVDMFIDVHNMTNNSKGAIGEFRPRSEIRRQALSYIKMINVQCTYFLLC